MMTVEQLEHEHAAAQETMMALVLRVQLYGGTVGKRAVKRPTATARDVEEIRTAQLAIIGAAIRYLSARGISNRLQEERAKIRALDTAAYREYLMCL